MTYFTTDTAAGALHDGSVEFSLDERAIVTVTNPPWQRAFDTERFVKFEDATVARPVEQTYRLNGDTHTFKKPRSELKQLAWQLDNAPHVLGHPDTKLLRDVQTVHGFFKNPTYDDEADDLTVDLYVPANDDEALSFIEDYGSVSIGFHNRLDWDTDEDGVDAYQRDLLIDHIASVKQGRCSKEQGCSITGDSVSSMSTAREDGHDHSEGDWVKWGDGAYGKIDEVIEDGCTTRGKGDMEVCADPDDPATVVEVYDNETGESKDEMVRHKMSTLQSWAGPTTDRCPGEDCGCGCHSDTYPVTADGTHGVCHTDADDTYYAVKESEGGPSYPIESCNDVRDAYNLRNNGDYSISTETLVERIKQKAAEMECPPEYKPWTSEDSFDTTMSDSDDEPDFDALIDGMTVGALAERNDHVQSLIDEKEALADEKDELESQKEMLEEQVEDLQEQLDEYQREEREELVEQITEHTDFWDEDALMEVDMDTLEERAEFVEDTVATSTTTVGDAEDAVQTDSTPDDERALSDGALDLRDTA